MITRIQLLRNIGLFDSVNSAATIALSRLTLIFAENGRGKTTLAAVLRSLATGDPLPITERKRLTAAHPPHVVVDCIGGPPSAIFQNNSWNRALTNVAVFDDVFINDNIYSGLSIDPEHRQNLHEFILGTQGVTLSRRLQELVDRIESHNRELRTRADAIPVSIRGSFSPDDFCELAPVTDVDAAIQTAERGLAASNEQKPIHDTLPFDPLGLPAFDVSALDSLLRQALPDLEVTAAAIVQAHLSSVGSGAESWVSDGMRRVPERVSGSLEAVCPFCAQSLDGSPVINHYRAYFGAAYSNLKNAIEDAITRVSQQHGGDARAGFERIVRLSAERRQFWMRFCETPELQLDTANISQSWQAAQMAILAALRAKQAAPLEPMRLSDDTKTVIATYDGHRQQVAALNLSLQTANARILSVKQQAAVGNAAAQALTLARLKVVKSRQTQASAILCLNYVTEKAAKAQTELEREQAKAALNEYRETVFPAYQTATNEYLRKFNAGFRLDSVTPGNTRSGPTCTYNVIINETSIPVTNANAAPGAPSFRNTLSAGDRNTLALAFFFASLDQDPAALATKTVIIDDPVSSLDDHRSLTTIQEIRRLTQRANQVIVLSHNKVFLCRIWERADTNARTALEVTRDGAGSTIREWDVNLDCVTEHDRIHALLREHIAGNVVQSREVARGIRPVLEAFFRVACPEHFPPGSLLGHFHNRCAQRLGTPHQILTQADTTELADLIEYANRFHHDTNAAINDGELVNYVGRTLRFTTRG